MTESNDYYQLSREEMLEFIPSETTKLLDIGCAEGRFAEAVRRKIPNCEIWGIEPVEAAAQVARRRMDHVICSRLDAIKNLPQGYFDVVTMNDSLEHFEYSEPVLEIVSNILRDDGRLVLSIPNVRHYINVLNLVFRNDWEYREFGILDRTHFRFFTTKSAARLLTQNGFKVDTVQGLNYTGLKLPYRILFSLAPRFFESMRHLQIAIVGRPVRSKPPLTD